MSETVNWEKAYRVQTERVAELRRENAALREDKETLDWLDQNAETVFFKFKPDNFRLNIRKLFRTARAKKPKP